MEKSWQGHVRDSVLSAFIDKTFPHLGGASIGIIENPTEEIAHNLSTKGHSQRLFMARNTAAVAPVAIVPKGPPKRLEENYLYASRAFITGALSAADYRFFQNAIGQSGTSDGFPSGVTSLDDLETNMDVGGQIAQGKNFVLSSIGISFNASASAANVAALMDAGALRFSKQGDQYVLRHGPARLWPGGIGVSGFAATTASTTTIQGAHNGVADPRATRHLKVPRVIKEKESFAYIYHVPRTVASWDGATAFSLAAPGVTMTIWLWGGQLDVIPG